MEGVVIKLAGVGVVAVFAILILRHGSPDSAMLLRMVTGVGLALLCVFAMTPIVEYIVALSSLLESERVSVAVSQLLKALGISLLTHVCANVCRDSGEGSIASYVELGGRLEIVILALPLIKEIVDMALVLLELTP